MKIKTAEVTGPALDWLVAKCEGVKYERRSYKEFDGIGGVYPVWATAFSTDWAQGGQIIERENIFPIPNISPDKLHPEWDFLAKRSHYNDMECPMYGGTALIASMRCYCCARLGEEVEVPDDLSCD